MPGWQEALWPPSSEASLTPASLDMGLNLSTHKIVGLDNLLNSGGKPL